MRYNLVIATLAILVIGIVSCSQSVRTPTPASVVTSEPTPVPVEPSVAAPASGQIAVASTSTPVPAEPVAANPTSAAVAVEKSVSIPQVIAPGPTPRSRNAGCHAKGKRKPLYRYSCADAFSRHCSTLSPVEPGTRTHRAKVDGESGSG